MRTLPPFFALWCLVTHWMLPPHAETHSKLKYISTFWVTTEGRVRHFCFLASRNRRVTVGFQPLLTRTSNDSTLFLPWRAGPCKYIILIWMKWRRENYELLQRDWWASSTLFFSSNTLESVHMWMGQFFLNFAYFLWVSTHGEGAFVEVNEWKDKERR